MTGKQTFEKTKNCRIMDPWLLGPSTVPWTIEFDKTNCVGRFLIKNTIKNISSLFLYSKIWWNTIKILECEPDSGSIQRLWFQTIFNWYSDLNGNGTNGKCVLIWVSYRLAFWDTVDLAICDVISKQHCLHRCPLMKKLAHGGCSGAGAGSFSGKW